jgi:hypothetical protein
MAAAAAAAADVMVLNISACRACKAAHADVLAGEHQPHVIDSCAMKSRHLIVGTDTCYVTQMASRCPYLVRVFPAGLLKGH